MKDHTIAHVTPGSATIEPSGANDDIRYVLNPEPAANAAGNHAPSIASESASDPSGAQPAGAGGLADCVIDNADGQLPDKTDSSVRGGKVGQESKRGAY